MSDTRKAFTLVEMMMVVAVISLIAGVFYFFLQRTNRTFYQNQLKYIIDSEAQLLVEYVKRDLSMSCKNESASNYLTESIIDHSESGDIKTWDFYKFHKYEDGKPLIKKVRYTYDSEDLTVVRELEGEKDIEWNDVVNFYITYYGLLPHHRYFYNIQLEISMGEEGASKKSEVFRIATSVESKYENHLVNFPGWLKNPNSVTVEDGGYSF